MMNGCKRQDCNLAPKAESARSSGNNASVTLQNNNKKTFSNMSRLDDCDSATGFLPLDGLAPKLCLAIFSPLQDANNLARYILDGIVRLPCFEKRTGGVFF